MTENIKVIYNDKKEVMLVLGEQMIIMERTEAEDLFVNLGHLLKAMDQVEAESPADAD